MCANINFTMRLLKTDPVVPGAAKLQLQEFFGDNVPSYAILSHTWGSDEVVFDDVQNGTVKGREGSAKINMILSQAREDGHGWLWIDTCCINKDSSAELSEAINSMYAYYQNSECCYAYLADVHDRPEHESLGEEAFSQQFQRSRWFTRGWCLQELLAPKVVLFFSAEWTPLGDKIAWQHEITTATRIDPEFLTQFQPIEAASVAKRMSWAATRQCTRDEDFAYCLMGLFDVNMPMLYGEGKARAFLRLQEEIMKSTDDHSIFAWIDTDPTRFPHGHGLLAESPKAFLHSGLYAPVEGNEERQPFSMTNRGLNIMFHLAALDENRFAATLACSISSGHTSSSGMHGFPVIYLRRLHTGSSQYVRVDCTRLGKTYQHGIPQRVYVRQHVRVTSDKLFRCVKLRKLYTTDDNYELIDIHSPLTDWNALAAWNPKRTLSEASFYAQKWVPSKFSTAFELIKPPNLTAALLFRHVVDGRHVALLLGVATTDFSLGFQFQEFISPMSSASTQLPEGWHQLLSSQVSQAGHVQLKGNLKPAGHPWLTDRHRVGCDVHTFTQTDRQIYYVDISIEDIVWKATVEQAKGTVSEIPHPVSASRSRKLFGLKKKKKT